MAIGTDVALDGIVISMIHQWHFRTGKTGELTCLVFVCILHILLKKSPISVWPILNNMLQNPEIEPIEYTKDALKVFFCLERFNDHAVFVNGIAI